MYNRSYVILIPVLDLFIDEDYSQAKRLKQLINVTKRVIEIKPPIQYFAIFIHYSTGRV
jgi:hypothetical protein